MISYICDNVPIDEEPTLRLKCIIHQEILVDYVLLAEKSTNFNYAHRVEKFLNIKKPRYKNVVPNVAQKRNHAPT